MSGGRDQFDLVAEAGGCDMPVAAAVGDVAADEVVLTEVAGTHSESP